MTDASTPGSGLPRRFRAGELEVDLPTWTATVGGRRLALEPRVFDLLLVLAARAPAVVGKDEILVAAWRGAAVTDNALARAVAALRQALDDDAATPRYVETVRGRGYRWLHLPEALDAAPSAPAPASPPFAPSDLAIDHPTGSEDVGSWAPAVARPQRSRSSDWRPRLLVGALVAALLGGALGILLGRSTPPTAAAAAAERLTSGELDTDPAFSPDGARLVYASRRGGGMVLVLRRLDASGPFELGDEVELVPGSLAAIEPAWSPDGSAIAFHSLSAGGLWVIPATGGTPRQVSRFGAQPAWSPDGRRLVFRSAESAEPGQRGSWPAPVGSTLWTLDLAGGGAQPLTRPGEPAGGHGDPAWSPDGSRVAFAAGDERGAALYLVSAAGGPPAAVLPADVEGNEPAGWRHPVWSRDGKALLVAQGGRRPRIARVPLATRRPQWLVDAAPGEIAALALSADGRRLAYAVAGAESRIEAVSSDGPTVAPRVLVPAGELRVSWPRLSPDGRRLAYSRLRPGAPPDLLVDDLTSGERTTLAGAGGVPRWTSAHQLLLDPLGEPREVDVTTRYQRRLAELHLPGLPESCRDAQAVRAPRAPQVACVVAHAGARELALWTPGRAAPALLTRFGASAGFASWSPDGSRLVAQVSGSSAEGGDELWVVPLTGDPRRLPTAQGRSWSPTWAPDGRRVAFAAQRDGRWDLAVVAEDAAERRLGLRLDWLEYVRWPDWSADGTTLVYERTRARAATWLVSLEPGG